MALLTPYWGLDSILVFSSLIIAVYLYGIMKFKYWANKGVLQFPPVPFLGNFKDCLSLKLSPPEFLKQLYNKSKGSPYVGFYIFHKPVLLIRDPELVKHVLVKDFNVFCDRYVMTNVHDRLGSTNLVTIKNPTWRVLRSKLSPVFSPGKLKKMLELMILVAEDLDQYLDKETMDTGNIVKVKDMCSSFTTDMVGSTAFGLKVNSLDNIDAPFRKCLRKMFDFNDFFRTVELFHIFFIPSLTRYTRAQFFGKESSIFLRNVFWNVINDRVASGEKRNDIIDVLIEMRRTHEKEGDVEGIKFSGDDLVAQAAIFFFAGTETSATAISFSLYELALNKEIQTTVRKEIQDALEETGGKITFEMIMALPYLHMVVSETLRKYPPLPFLDRVASKQYKFPNSDLVIEKGTPVYISVDAMHLDAEYYPEPEKYDPMRFSEENKQNRPPFTYFPFGEGPHSCIAFRLGFIQTKLGLIQILSKYEVSPCEKTTIPLAMNPKAVFTTALDDIHLFVRKITPNVV